MIFEQLDELGVGRIAPLKRMRSLNRHRCGDVNVPTS